MYKLRCWVAVCVSNDVHLFLGGGLTSLCFIHAFSFGFTFMCVLLLLFHLVVIVVVVRGCRRPTVATPFQKIDCLKLRKHLVCSCPKFQKWMTIWDFVGHQPNRYFTCSNSSGFTHLRKWKCCALSVPGIQCLKRINTLSLRDKNK